MIIVKTIFCETNITRIHKVGYPELGVISYQGK